jgi:MFS family permease
VEPLERNEADVTVTGQGSGRLALQGLVALLMLVPVTLPVPVLRTLVHERFGVTELLTSLFMSINMVGAVIAAPLVGSLADRFGGRKRIALTALGVDALCFFGMTLPIPFVAFMGLRFVEGAAHIAALSMLLSLASTSVGEGQRGRALGLVGAGLLLGVAIGAPVGGLLGRDDPTRTLWAGGVVVLAAAALAGLVLRDEDRPDQDRATAAGLRVALREQGRLVIPLLFAFADRFTVGFYTTTFSLYLSRVHGADPPQIGLLISAFMLPFALLSYPFGWLSERTSRVALLGIGSVVYGLGTASLVLWPVDVLPFVMAAIGVAAAVMFVPTMLLATEYASDALRSTALAAFNAAGSLGFIVGPIVGALVSEGIGGAGDWRAGYGAAFAVAGGSELLLVAVALPFLRGASSPRAATD